MLQVHAGSCHTVAGFPAALSCIMFKALADPSEAYMDQACALCLWMVII